jgi:hypothetical protein
MAWAFWIMAIPDAFPKLAKIASCLAMTGEAFPLHQGY